MKITIRNSRQRQEGAILVYFIMASIFISAIASLGAYVWTTTNLAHRRGDMIAAEQFAEGGAVIACADLNNAYTNATGVFPANLAALSSYALNTSLTTSSQKVYQRTISAPFTNQTITAQIWVPNAASVATARVVTTATVGDITQTATVNLSLGFAYPAAIISVSPGTTSTSVSKSAAQAGNVVISGAGNGPLVVDGNTGMAVMANGQVNVASTNDASVPSNSISRTNENTANEIADLTAQGTNALFDFNRFIAVANATTNSYNTNTHNNHFANVDIFASALNAAANHTLEGVVVVDIGSLVNEDPTLFPNGINIHGTLFYNFAPTFNLLSKFVVTAALNINPANMTGFVATNPSTYPSGYPPTYQKPDQHQHRARVPEFHFSRRSAGIDVLGWGGGHSWPGQHLGRFLYAQLHGNRKQGAKRNPAVLQGLAHHGRRDLL